MRCFAHLTAPNRNHDAASAGTPRVRGGPAELDAVAPAERVRAAGLSKSFGALQALRGIDLELNGGEVVALVGPNGAGKSTLLRILSTMVLPDEGWASVNGYDAVAEPRAVRRSVGLMNGNERAWYWRLTGRHNLEFFSLLYGLRRAEATRRAEQLLVEVGLADAADSRFSKYSAGMRARLSLARALILEPPVLLLDEPLQSLDPEAVEVLWQMIESLVRDRGTGVLYATHDLAHAASFSSRVLVLAGGRISHSSDGETTAELLASAFRAQLTS